MLTLEESGWNFKTIRILSNLNILPIEIKEEVGKVWIQSQSSKIRVFLWKCLIGCGIFHWFYMFCRLVQSTLLEPEKYFRWDHFVVHFVLTILYIVFYYTAFLLFSRNKEESLLIFNHLFEQRENPVQKIMDEEKRQKQKGRQEVVSTTGLDSSSVLHSGQVQSTHADPDIQIWGEWESRSGVRPLLKWPPHYSLVELVNRLQSIISAGSKIPAIFVLAIEPSRSQFLYSALPLEYQNVMSFSSLLAVEALFLTVCLENLYFSTFLQLTFFAKCQHTFQRLALQLGIIRQKFQNRSLGVKIGGRDLKKEIWMLRQILEEMRELVFFIELFNRCFPFCIFAYKNTALWTSIFFYFFTIRHFEEFPIIATFVGYFAIAVFYAVVYGNAFSIPEKIERLKREFLLTAEKTAAAASSQNPNQHFHPNFWPEMKREIERIRNVGIQVGSFHQMERGSTPNFINFVVDQVVSLLVSFPR